MPVLPIPGGTLQGQLEDLQSRFNLNNLVKNGKTSSKDILLFEHLLRVLELSPTLVPVVLDWIDSDGETRISNGAEDNTYLIKTPAYRTSNTLFSTPSEIRLLAGFDEKAYQKLLPYITTLPTHTRINVNTAPSKILIALVDGLTEMDATALITARNEKPFESVQNFLIHDALAGLKIDINNISISSAYFMLTEQVQIDRGRAELKSILHRLPNKINIIMRTQGGE